MSAARRTPLSRRRHAFTLVEVLVAMLLIAIVVPAVSKCITTVSSRAGLVQDRARASALAESKLADIVAEESWESGATSGDFGDQAPGFSWQLTSQTWNGGSTSSVTMQELDLTVTWKRSSHDYSLMVSTLAYNRQQNGF